MVQHTAGLFDILTGIPPSNTQGTSAPNESLNTYFKGRAGVRAVEQTTAALCRETGDEAKALGIQNGQKPYTCLRQDRQQTEFEHPCYGEVDTKNILTAPVEVLPATVMKYSTPKIDGTPHSAVAAS